MRSRPRAALVAVTAALTVLVAGGCAASTGPKPELVPPGDSLGSTDFFVDPDSAAAAQVREWSSAGRTADAEQLRKIAEQPLPFRPVGDPDQIALDVLEYVGRASDARKRPLLVASALAGDPCAADPDAYQAWLAGLVGGLGDASSTVVLEPGAVSRALACSDSAARERAYGLLSDAVAILGSAGATVYLDAGPVEPGTDLDGLAAGLRSSGIADAHGFSVNVGGTQSTEESTSVGSQLADLVDGKPFVIDTSRNGPADGSTTEESASSCNPQESALGNPPTTQTGDPRVDALLWITSPGVSDGPCRPGDPAEGEWWPEYALGIAERSGR
jgi:endoglucanase